MAEAQRADQEAGDDLVADAEQQRAFEHRVAERDHRALRDVVAAEQRQVHARLPLRHPVAHGRDAARDLRRRADLAREQFDLFRIAAVRLMRREHVVIAGDDADIHLGAGPDHGLVLTRGGKAVREVAARQVATIGARLALAVHEVEVSRAAWPAAHDNAVGNLRNHGVQISHASLPRRVRSARSTSSAPSCPLCNSAAPYRPQPRHRGSNRSTATAPRPRRGARKASGHPR